jgi:hypothetical protein
MSRAGNVTLTAAGGLLAIRRELATTPGRLRLAAGLSVLGAIVFGVVAVHAAGMRQQAVQDVRRTEKLLVSAVDLSTNLSDAHATAAGSFLAGGPEPAATRQLYEQKVRAATAAVARLSGVIGTSSSAALQMLRITQKLPVYTRLIEAARTNYRLGYPVGAAYLREASRAMRDEHDAMLPAARELYRIEARSLTESYETGASRASVLTVVLSAGALLALLVATQIYLARRMHRIINPRVLLATALLLGLLGWTVVAFTKQSSALEEARRSGSDPIELLTTARIVAARAAADESITLSARGGGGGAKTLAGIDVGFALIVKPIAGLLAAVAASTGQPTDDALAAYRRYRAAHERVVTQERIGQFSAAVNLAVGPGSPARPSSKDAAHELNSVLDKEVAVARRHFAAAALSAGSLLDGLPTGIVVLSALCALLAWSGVRQRLEEYR